MTNDLVKRLRNVQFWQADCDVRMQAADRIEELEAKLAKAFEALCLADAALSGANMNTLSMRVVEKSVKSTLAELKGQDDE